jgi:hypothetical protein
MKKLLFALWIMVIGFVACTNSNVVDENAAKQKGTDTVGSIKIINSEIHANALDSLNPSGRWVQGPIKITNNKVHKNMAPIRTVK